MNGKPKSPEFECSTVCEILDLLAAGDLPADKAECYAIHIAGCAGCRAKYEKTLAAYHGVRDALCGAIPKHSEAADVWPSVREQIIHPVPRESGRSWLILEPARALVVAGVLTVGLYVLGGVRDSNVREATRPFPVYESAPVIVSTATVDQRPARISGIESGDGETVFLWLE